VVSSINPLGDTILQERVPVEMRARIFSAVVLCAVPLGTFTSGFVEMWLGLFPTLIVMGILYFLSTLTLLLNPALKKM
jgi:hypothetical protein